MADTIVNEILTRAAAIYAASPSHAAAADAPADGTECATTAISRAAGEMPDSPWYAIARARDLLSEAAGKWIVEYNAEHTTEEVLAVFEAAGATLPKGTK